MLTIGILSWGSHKTLTNTLQSYQDHGLDKLADQKLIFFQEQSPEDIELATRFGYDASGSKSNIGIAGGYRTLVQRATGDLFLFLENDWELITSPDSQILQGSRLLSSMMVDVVRYRHRTNPGNPLWTRQFEGQESSRPEHLLDSIHWTNPSKFHQIGVRRIDDILWYWTSARNANWTNNPTMFRTSWLRQNLIWRFGEKDIERDLQSWWEHQAFYVAQSEGLFTHNRLD
jgi:hypothetical protein